MRPLAVVRLLYPKTSQTVRGQFSHDTFDKAPRVAREGEPHHPTDSQSLDVVSPSSPLSLPLLTSRKSTQGPLKTLPSPARTALRSHNSPSRVSLIPSLGLIIPPMRAPDIPQCACHKSPFAAYYTTYKATAELNNPRIPESAAPQLPTQPPNRRITHHKPPRKTPLPISTLKPLNAPSSTSTDGGR